MSALGMLLGDQLRTWVKARGFWIILLAALVPPLLTATWVGTHQDDLVPIEISHDGGQITQGDLVNISALIRNDFDHEVGPFNATLEVGFFEPVGDENSFRERKAETFEIAGLGAGETTSITMNWTAQPGTFIFQARADSDDAILEIEENNNHRFMQVQVSFPAVEQPTIPVQDTNGSQAANLTLVEMSLHPSEVYHNEDTIISVTVRNDGVSQVDAATIDVEIYRALATGYAPLDTFSENVTLAVGEETTLDFPWRPTTIAQYAVLAVAAPAENVTETTPGDNAAIKEFFADRRFVYEEPAEKETAKEFYRTVLSILHLKLLIPLLALWYGAGVIEDEREKGNLPYLLTRPLGRWTLPVTRAIVSVLVLGIAVTIGVVATYALLLGVGQPAQGFLTAPLLITMLAVVVYTGVFTLLGVATKRPYLWGLAYILGFEAWIAFGTNLVINDRVFLQDWWLNLSLSHQMAKGFESWDPATGIDLASGGTSLLVLSAIGVIGVALAAYLAGRREYDA